MKTKQLWKVKTSRSIRTTWIVVADFAELQSVLVEDEVISAKFVRDVEVVEDVTTFDRSELVEDIARFVEERPSRGARAIRQEFGPPVEDEEASKT